MGIERGNDQMPDEITRVGGHTSLRLSAISQQRNNRQK
jgi:hypothetical protein